MKRILYLLLLFVFIILSACSDDAVFPTYSSVKGFIKSGLDQSPIQGKVIRLIDLSGSIDETDFQNEDLFIDSTITCGRGFWKFDKLAPGKYGVIIDDISHRYTLANDSDSLIFELDEAEHLELDMIGIPNLQNSVQTNLVLEYYNIPDEVTQFSIRIGRMKWFLIVPIWDYHSISKNAINNESVYEAVFSAKVDWGYYKITDLFSVNLKYDGPFDIIDDLTFGDAFGDGPSYIKYRIDYQTMSYELVESRPLK